MNFKADCKSIGIGSLPYKEIDTALNSIIDSIDIPFWPQLPKRNPKEGMVLQFSQGVPCLKLEGNSLLFDPSRKDEVLEKFYEKVISKDIDYFAISCDYAQGLHGFLNLLQKKGITSEYVKGQITGPFTFASSVKDKEGRDLLGDSVMMEAAIHSLAMKALWQIRRFKDCGKKSIIFIDEPYLGCFGSAYSPVNKESVRRYLTELISLVKSEDDVLVGIHCCGNTDWGMLLSLDIDIISFDAYGFLDKFLLYTDDIKRFLQQAKIIAWGIVPTTEFDRAKVNLKDLLGRIENQAIDTLAEKGLDRAKILYQSLITPSCGLGTIDISRDTNIASDILGLVKEVSSYLKQGLSKII